MKMKNWFPTLLGVGVIAGSLSLSSCEDEFTEADAIAKQDSTLTALKKLENENAIALDELNHDQEMAFRQYQDSLERIGPVVNYTVTVIAGGSANTNARTQGQNFAEGATITLVQGGVSRTETTGAGGVATFGDLRIGEAVVTVEATDHTTVTYTTSLGTANWEHQEDNVETTIPVFPLTVEAGASEVNGIAWAELDLTNDEPEFAEGAVVRATISVAGALDAYDIPFGSSNKGEIRTASYSDFVRTATVGADGRYSLIIPNGNADNGEGIDAKVEFLPFEAEQTYLAWQGDSLAVVKKQVIFDPNAADDGHIDGNLPSVWVEVGAPTGTASGLEFAVTPLRDDLKNSDVELENKGADYVVGDKFNFSKDADDNAAYLEVTSVDANGGITGYTIIDNGASYDAAPSLEQDAAASGTGASFMSTYTGDYEVSIANGGSGYWDIPEVLLTEGWYENGVLTEYASDIDLSGDTELAAGTIRDNDDDNVVYTIYNTAIAPKLEIIPLVARQAVVDLGEIKITDQNRIEGDDDQYIIDFDQADSDQGAGYLTPATVTFKSVNGMGSGATGVAYVTGGVISQITITNPGAGYLDQVNSFDSPAAATASKSATKSFKPASSNPNYNFDFGTGNVIQ